jgi:hypothetical protein
MTNDHPGGLVNTNGIVVGLATFLIIGIFHPIVIKTEYHFGTKAWPVFLVVGLASVAGSVFVGNTLVSAVLGVFGFSALWSVRELSEQTQRVRKGWFPKKSDKQEASVAAEKDIARR